MSEITASKTKKCPRCREESPAEAAMCWACYAPLNGANLAPLQINSPPPQVRAPQPSWWRDNARSFGGYAISGALVSSGWWRGKTRFAVAGAGALAVALILKSEKRGVQERKQHEVGWRDEGSAMCRIVDHILLFAIKDNASQVRIIRGKGDVTGQYLLDGEWKERITFPRDIFPDLQKEFLQRGEGGKVHLSASGVRAGVKEFALSDVERATTFSLRILVEPPSAEILLTRL